MWAETYPSSDMAPVGVRSTTLAYRRNPEVEPGSVPGSRHRAREEGRVRVRTISRTERAFPITHANVDVPIRVKVTAILTLRTAKPSMLQPLNRPSTSAAPRMRIGTPVSPLEGCRDMSSPAKPRILEPTLRIQSILVSAQWICHSSLAWSRPF
jgi:hypothetical protein